MIYLKNNTILQELYIPRQDYISNTTGSSGTYAEGYADGYESGYTSGSTDGFDSGYTEGYSSGETHQKGLLTSTEFTENGEYQRENGWSAITVNVSGSVLEGKEIVVSEDITVVTPDSGYGGFSAVTVDATEYGQTNYDSGFDDGFTDGYSSGSSEGYDRGYTSGETHQKSLLVSTAITENGQYTRENGYSAITVNVPTGTSYNIEENKQFTANTNGDYTITPSTASTTVNAHLNDNRYVISIDFNGYPSGYFNVLTIKSDNDNEYINVYYSGHMPYHNSIGWISDPVSYEQKSSTQLILHINNANANYGWEKNSGFLEPYDVMSAVSLNVNVPMPKIETNKEFTATTNGYYWVAPSSGSVSVNDHFDSDDDCYYITATTSGYPLVGRYNIFYIEDEFDSSKGQIDVYIDNGYLDYSDRLWDGGSIIDYEKGDRLILEVRNANNAFGWVSDDDYNLKYNAMNGLGVVVEVPQTGHTDQELQDAYDSGYTSGENDVISTFSSITITQNGQYGDSAHPMSSITVNVPQSGGSGVKYVEYIETDNTQIGWDTGYNIGTDIDASIYLDFMPISGNGYGDYWFAYYGDGEEYVLFRRAGNNDPIGFMFGNNHSVKDGGSYSVTDGNRYLISLDKYGITDENTGTLLESVNSSYINSTNNLWLNCDGNPQVVSRCIPARYYGFRVENGNGETVLDMRPCLDGNDVPCFYDEVSQTYIYHQGEGTPVAGSLLGPTIETNHSFTATSNGTYTIKPFKYGVVDVYDGGGSIHFYIKVSGYTENKYIGHIENWNNTERIDISWNASNNSLTADTTNWSQSDINDIELDVDSQGNDLLEIDFDDYGGTWFGDGDTGFSYNSMGMVSLTVDVPQSGSSVTLGRGSFTGNGTYSASTDNLDGYSAVTVDIRSSSTLVFFSTSMTVYSVRFVGSNGKIHTKSTKFRYATHFVNVYDYNDVNGVPTIFAHKDYKPSVYISNELIYLTSYSGVRFIQLPNSIETVYNNAFLSATALTEVVLGDKIQRINDGAFSGCTALTTLSCYAENEPYVAQSAFTSLPASGTFHYPQDSDYTTFISMLPSGWTSVGDLYATAS